jgi:holo-[acyl-carrier protein] synthase
MPERTTLLAASLSELAADAARTGRVGTDAVHIETWERHLRLGGERLARRIYTSGEIEFCEGRADRLSTRLAAKEAALKALGTGVRGVSMVEVEVVSESSGRPTLRLHDRASGIAETLGLSKFEVSLCHEEGFAMAVVIAQSKEVRA